MTQSPAMPGLGSSVRQRQTAHEFVRETIRQAILTGEIQSGTRLVQADVAEQLRVSTTPVREALRDLASEGLITLDAHRGGIVKEMSVSELHEIWDIRMILEPEAIRLAAKNITDEQLDRIQAMHDAMLANPTSRPYVDYNRELHLSIYDAAGLPRLSTIITGLIDASVMYVSAHVNEGAETLEHAMHDHDNILEALRERDGDAAAAATLTHIQITQSLLPRLD